MHWSLNSLCVCVCVDKNRRNVCTFPRAEMHLLQGPFHLVTLIITDIIITFFLLYFNYNILNVSCEIHYMLTSASYHANNDDAHLLEGIMFTIFNIPALRVSVLAFANLDRLQSTAEADGKVI